MNFKHKDTSVKKLLYSEVIDPHDPLIKKKGKKYKLYRKQWEDTGKFLIETKYPTQLDFELNPSCNYKCPMCTWSAEKTFGLGRESWMPFEKFKKIIDECSNNVKSVNLNYINEPLIRKDIVDFVDYSSKKGIMEVMFNTNGLLLTEDMSYNLIKSGLTKLSISLDAITSNTYDKIRIGGDYKKVMENIDSFLRIRKKLRKKIPLLKVTFLLSSVNKQELPRFLKYWKKRADLVSIQNPCNPFKGKKLKQKEKWLDIKTVKDKIENSKISVGFDYDSSTRCAQPYQRLVIDSDGAAHPCCNFRGKDILMGNVFKDSVYKIWNNKLFKELRKIQKNGQYAKNKVCKVCIHNMSAEAPELDQ